MNEKKSLLDEATYKQLHLQWVRSTMSSMAVMLFLTILFSPVSMGMYWIFLSILVVAFTYMAVTLMFKWMHFLDNKGAFKSMNSLFLFVRVGSMVSILILPALFIALFFWIFHQYVI